jgi:prepilin-type N-terminal cleavage/methylation domain-containing protein
MRPCSQRTAAGFTLVELLVVIAIIGTLAAMLLPAVQMARESGRRSSCISNLRQVGLAIHAYHSAHNAFPPGGIALGPNPDDPTYSCWTIQILPFLDQKALYDRYSQAELNESVMNREVYQTFIGTYSCPSDMYRNMPVVPDSGPAHRDGAAYMPGSYRGVGGRSDGSSGSWDGIPVTGGITPSYRQLARRWRGVFHVADGRLCPESFASVSDGLSNTLMVGESTTRPVKVPLNNKDPAVVKRISQSYGMARRTFWAYTYGPYNRSDAVPQGRTLLGDIDRCSLLGGDGDFNPCFRGWGSMHQDIVNFVYCDGSVQALPLTVDSRVFANAGSIAAKEPPIMN